MKNKFYFFIFLFGCFAGYTADAHASFVHGYFSNQYRKSWTSEVKDQDYLGTLSLDLGDSEKNTVTGHFMGAASVSLDGTQDHRNYFPFDRIADTYKDNHQGLLYSAHIDLHRLSVLELMRVGRQSIYETPEVSYFDGLHLKSSEFGNRKYLLGGYAGVPVHLYESSPNGDFQFGTYLQLQPWKKAGLRADWMYVEGRNQFRDEKRKNNFFGLGLKQNFTENLNLKLDYSRLDNEDRGVNLTATFQKSELNLLVQGSYVEVFSPQKDNSFEFDPFYYTLLTYFPYRQTNWLVSKGFGEHFILDSGFSLRRLKDKTEEGGFNREFERYFITPSLVDVVKDGFGVSLTMDYWKTSGRNIFSLGADFSQKWMSNFKSSFGTYFSLYKYDYYSGREANNVRDYYVKLNYQVLKHLKTEVKYDYESDDFSKYHTLKAGVICSF